MFRPKNRFSLFLEKEITRGGGRSAGKSDRECHEKEYVIGGISERSGVVTR